MTTSPPSETEDQEIPLWEKVLLSSDPLVHEVQRELRRVQRRNSDLEEMVHQLETGVTQPLKTKPMRIRCMELPMEHDGDVVRTPYLLIVDRMPADHARELMEQLSEEHDGERLRDATGARSWLFFTDEIQIGDNV